MHQTTLEIIRAGLRADTTVTPRERARLIALLRQPALSEPSPIISSKPRLVRRAEVAMRLSCSTRTVDNLAVTGVLRKCKFPGRVRAAGFLESDIESLILSNRRQGGGQ